MFTISLKSLAANIAHVKRTAGVRARGIDALKVVRLSVSGGVATIGFYDYETAVSVRMPVVGEDMPETLVDIAELASAVRAAGSKGDATVSLENRSLVIVAGDVSVSVAVSSVPADEVPSMPAVEGGETVVMDGEDFAAASAVVGATVGKDDSLPMLTGVRVEVEDGAVDFASTDRFRLGRGCVTPANIAGDVVGLVAGRTLCAVGKRAVKDDAVSLRFGTVAGTPHVEMVTDDSTVISRLIDADFPRWRNLLPDDDEQFRAAFTVDARSLAPRFKSLASSARHARIHVRDEGTVTVEGVDELTRTAPAKTVFSIPVGEFACEDYLGELVSAFDPKFLAEILASVPKGVKARAGFRKNRMLSLRWSGGESVVMPVRLSSD